MEKTDLGYYQLLLAIFAKEEMFVIQQSLIKPAIDGLIKGLTTREQTVLKMRFGLAAGKISTLQEIGNLFGVCRERVRQLERKAVRKLKHPSRKNKLIESIKELGHIGW